MSEQADLLNRSAHALLDGVGARVPTPGGGSVAAVAGALAVGLARMVAAYSTGERVDPARVPADDAAEQLACADRMLRQLVNEDAAAYDAYRTARKSDDAGARARAEGVAISVPLEIAAVATTALGLMDRFKAVWNRNLVSDLGAAAVLADACVEAAAYSARINLRDAAEADPNGEVRKEVEHLRAHAKLARESIVDFVEANL